MNLIAFALLFPASIVNMPENTTYRYDIDGGACDHFQYAEFINNETIFISGGPLYMGDGGIIVEQHTLVNGMIQYVVSPRDVHNAYYVYTLNPDTGDIGAFETQDPAMLKEEAEDIMNLSPCT